MLSTVPNPIGHKIEARGLRYSVLQINRGASEVTALQLPSRIAQRQLCPHCFANQLTEIMQGKGRSECTISARHCDGFYVYCHIHALSAVSGNIYKSVLELHNVKMSVKKFRLTFSASRPWLTPMFCPENISRTWRYCVETFPSQNLPPHRDIGISLPQPVRQSSFNPWPCIRSLGDQFRYRNRPGPK